MQLPRVYVVLLNWNGWRDTIACLESLLSLEYDNVSVIVCDNASSNESMDRLREWPLGHQSDELAVGPMGSLVASRQRSRPGWRELTREQAETPATGAVDVNDWALIQTGANLGFAGGCNVGLRHALARGDADYVWLLNNDTVVAPTALNELVQVANASPQPGITGSTLLFYDRPDTVQALGGGTFNRWRAMTQHIGEGLSHRAAQAAGAKVVQDRLAYVVGASMLVSKEFIKRVGLLHEAYFLYFEELDWAERAKRANPPFAMGYAAGSLVYHRVGASAGTAARSLSSIAFLNRSRMMFMKRFYPRLLPVARMQLGWESVKAALKGRLAEAAVLSRIALSAPGS